MKYLQQCNVIEILHMLHKSTSISDWPENIDLCVQYILHKFSLTSHLYKKSKNDRYLRISIYIEQQYGNE